MGKCTCTPISGQHRCVMANSHSLYRLGRSHYRISSVIRQSFFFQNNTKDLDPSCKTDLDLWDCLGGENWYYSKISSH